VEGAGQVHGPRLRRGPAARHPLTERALPFGETRPVPACQDCAGRTRDACSASSAKAAYSAAVARGVAPLPSRKATSRDPRGKGESRKVRGAAIHQAQTLGLLELRSPDRLTNRRPAGRRLDGPVPSGQLARKIAPGRLGCSPERSISGVRQGQLPSRPEDGDRLLHEVEHCLGQVELRSREAGKAYLAADVLEQEGQGAVRMRPARDTIGLAARKRPGLAILSLGRSNLECRQLFAPGRVSRGSGRILASRSRSRTM
jgi:hypothetical protein